MPSQLQLLCFSCNMKHFPPATHLQQHWKCAFELQCHFPCSMWPALGPQCTRHKATAHLPKSQAAVPYVELWQAYIHKFCCRMLLSIGIRHNRLCIRHAISADTSGSALLTYCLLTGLQWQEQRGTCMKHLVQWQEQLATCKSPTHANACIPWTADAVCLLPTILCPKRCCSLVLLFTCAAAAAACS